MSSIGTLATIWRAIKNGVTDYPKSVGSLGAGATAAAVGAGVIGIAATPVAVLGAIVGVGVMVVAASSQVFTHKKMEKVDAKSSQWNLTDYIPGGAKATADLYIEKLNLNEPNTIKSAEEVFVKVRSSDQEVVYNFINDLKTKIPEKSIKTVLDEIKKLPGAEIVESVKLLNDLKISSEKTIKTVLDERMKLPAAVRSESVKLLAELGCQPKEFGKIIALLINVANIPKPDEIATILKQLKSLKSLGFTADKINDKILQALTKIPDLEVRSEIVAKVQELNVPVNEIKDGIEALAQIPDEDDRSHIVKLLKDLKLPLMDLVYGVLLLQKIKNENERANAVQLIKDFGLPEKDRIRVLENFIWIADEELRGNSNEGLLRFNQIKDLGLPAKDILAATQRLIQNGASIKLHLANWAAGAAKQAEKAANEANLAAQQAHAAAAKANPDVNGKATEAATAALTAAAQARGAATAVLAAAQLAAAAGTPAQILAADQAIRTAVERVIQAVKKAAEATQKAEAAHQAAAADAGLAGGAQPNVAQAGVDANATQAAAQQTTLVAINLGQLEAMYKSSKLKLAKRAEQNANKAYQAANAASAAATQAAAAAAQAAVTAQATAAANNAVAAAAEALAAIQAVRAAEQRVVGAGNQNQILAAEHDLDAAAVLVTQAEQASAAATLAAAAAHQAAQANIAIGGAAGGLVPIIVQATADVLAAQQIAQQITPDIAQLVAADDNAWKRTTDSRDAFLKQAKQMSVPAEYKQACYELLAEVPENEIGEYVKLGNRLIKSAIMTPEQQVNVWAIFKNIPKANRETFVNDVEKFAKVDSAFYGTIEATGSTGKIIPPLTLLSNANLIHKITSKETFPSIDKIKERTELFKITNNAAENYDGADYDASINAFLRFTKTHVRSFKSDSKRSAFEVLSKASKKHQELINKHVKSSMLDADRILLWKAIIAIPTDKITPAFENGLEVLFQRVNGNQFTQLFNYLAKLLKLNRRVDLGIVVTNLQKWITPDISQRDLNFVFANITY